MQQQLHTTSSKHQDYSPLILSAVVLGALFLWQYLSLIGLTDGTFSYALDDAYIHLALSENIMQGHYGVNLQDYSAPSSSILWSFIMAPLATWQYWPLTVNIVLSLIALYIWHYQTGLFLPGSKFKNVRLGLSLSFIFLANLVGVSFTGMENLLQLVVSMVICTGLFQLIETKKVSRWLLFAIIIAPLVRYETISLSCIALLFLLVNKHYRLFAITSLFMLIPLVGFSFYLNSLDLGFLPSSISAKSSALQSSAIISTLQNFYINIYEPTGSLLMILLLPLVWAGAVQWQKNPQVTLLTLMIAAAVCAHLALGRIGNWGRYEIYIWISLLLTLGYVFKEHLKAWYLNPQFPRLIGYIALAFFTVICAKRYIVTTTMSSVGGANIALQQYQMHRFATEFWKKDIAVNDLGWVAYQNDHYVLDLWGLANKEALELRKAGADDFLDLLTRNHDIKLAMIYKVWFEAQMPSHWQLVGTLNLPDAMRDMTPFDRRVQFYATDPASVAEIKEKMQAFELTLPGNAYITYEESL